MKLKLPRLTLPTWARIALSLTTIVLPASFLWFLANQILRASYVIELAAKLSKTGLLTQPEILELTKGAFIGGDSITYLCASVIAITAVNSVMIFVSVSPSKASHGCDQCQ